MGMLNWPTEFVAKLLANNPYSKSLSTFYSLKSLKLTIAIHAATIRLAGSGPGTFKPEKKCHAAS